MNNTLTNGFRLLEFLAESGKTHSVKEIAEVFHMPNSHICRLLKTLVETGYVEQNSSRQYRISNKILTLSNACLSRMTVRTKVHPYLVDLGERMNCETYLAMPLEGQALIVDVVYKNNRISDSALTIGKINPVFYTACGKLCAAWQPSDVQEKLLARADLRKVTQKTIVDPEQLLQEFKRIRQQGYAVCDSESGDNVLAVAAPVLDCNGELLAAIGAVDLFHDEIKKNNFIDQVRENAQSASFAMGYVC